ncbi:MAG: thioredoxin-like domain-containing protein [Bacteroidia bacterium]
MIRFSSVVFMLASVLLFACGESSSPASPDSQADAVASTVSESGKRQWPALKAPEKEGYKITVNAQALPDTVYLAFHMGNKQYYKDTVLSKNNKAVFEGNETLPGGIYLIVFPPDNRYIEVLVTNDQFFDVSLDMNDLVGKLEIKGSRDNDLFYESQRFIAKVGEQITAKNNAIQALPEGDAGRASLEKELKDLNQQLIDHRLEFMEKYPDGFYTKVLYTMRDPEPPVNPDTSDKYFNYRYIRAHFWDDVDWRDSQLLRTPVLENKIMTYMEKLTIQHPDSLILAAKELIDYSRANREVFRYAAITLLNKYGKSKIMGQDAVFAAIVEDAYASGEAWWMEDEELQKLVDRAKAISPTLLGHRAPGFTMTDPSGKAYNLYNVKGKYTILYFWDYDCGHCKQVTPKVAELYNTKYHNRDVALVAISINGSVDVWKEKIKDYELDKYGLNLQDHARATGFDDEYDLSSTPRLFVLDEDKKILAKQIAVDQLEEILDRYLDGKKE